MALGNSRQEDTMLPKGTIKMALAAAALFGAIAPAKAGHTKVVRSPHIDHPEVKLSVFMLDVDGVGECAWLLNWPRPGHYMPVGQQPYQLLACQDAMEEQRGALGAYFVMLGADVFKDARKAGELK